jgi:hypothetical protein
MSELSRLFFSQSVLMGDWTTRSSKYDQVTAPFSLTAAEFRLLVIQVPRICPLKFIEVNGHNLSASIAQDFSHFSIDW